MRRMGAKKSKELGKGIVKLLNGDGGQRNINHVNGTGEKRSCHEKKGLKQARKPGSATRELFWASEEGEQQRKTN